MKKNHSSYLISTLMLLLLFSLPESITEKTRGATVAALTPFWKSLLDFKLFLKAPLERHRGEDGVLTKEHEVQRLLLENQLLGLEIVKLKDLVEQEYFLLQQLKESSQLPLISQDSLSIHEKETLDLFELQLRYLSAQVIFRPINTWNSSLWINCGEADNRRLNFEVVAKNSPVVVGISIVGVVDFVGEHESRVRLVTDSGLNPSVRVRRGSLLLAKGELCGESEPLWRSHQSLIQGVGFNYDFSDSEGPARDLRTGEPLEVNSKLTATTILQVNDLLITTGMDGVFPKGLKAGIVKKILPLKEGDYAYNLIAESTAGNLNDLALVFVLPPSMKFKDKL